MVLAAIKELQRTTGRSPTLEEIRQYLNYASVSSVQRHVDALKQKGYLEHDKYQNRGLRLTHQHLANLPLVGNVACGTPLLAEENVEAYVTYDRDKLHGDVDQYFFLQAVGDSMNKADIDDGDLVLIRKSNTAEPGKRVVALIGDSATIKKLDRENNFWVLVPESTNSKHKKLIMLDDFSIQGVVVDVKKRGG